MINFIADSTKANNYLNSITQNVNSLNELMATKGRDILKQSNLNSFEQQRTPNGIVWRQSLAAKKAKRQTMIDTGDLMADTQKDINYKMEGTTLEEFTSVVGDEGPNDFYGFKHNFGDWEFAGLDIESTKKMNLLITNFIMDGK